MYCIKCKTSTKNVPDSESIIEGKRMRMTALCACGTKKSSFIKSQKGGDAIHAELSNETYKENPRKEVEGYLLDEELSNKKTKVYHNPEKKDTIIAHRGSRITEKGDIKADVLIATSTLDENSKRVKRATNVVKKADEKYEGSITNTGHSLGGTVAKKVALQLPVEKSRVEAYNAGAGPGELLIGKYNQAKCALINSEECKKLRNVTDNLVIGDPISTANLTNKVGKIKLVAPKSANPHSLANFLDTATSAKVQVGGCECRIGYVGKK